MDHSKPFCLLALAAVFACIGCPGTLDNPSRFLVEAGDDSPVGDEPSACPDIPSSVFIPTCAATGCHSAAAKSQNLDLQSPGVAARLVGVAASGGGLLIDPTDPSQSVVYTKLTATPPFGSRMPLGMIPLDDAMLACVLTWVSQQTASTGSGDAGNTDAGQVDAVASDAATSDAGGGDANADAAADAGDAGG